MKKNYLNKGLQTTFLLIVMTLLVAAPSWAAAFNMYYEQVVKDSWGNEIGYKTYKITSPDQLPDGNPWKSYLNLRNSSGQTVFEYCQNTAKQLAQPLNLMMSDKNSVCNTKKTSSGTWLSLYKYVTQYSTDASKQFIFYHEFGHVAMLNGYPKDYKFSNLDYGDDNRHYMDEILPNNNTAWVEGWANAFGAQKNNGKVFNLSMKDDSIVAFLKNNTFEEMNRNELFVGKVIYDSFYEISKGKEKAFNVISKTGPHTTLQGFCNGFTKLYPNDKAGLAKILVENSHGKMTLNDVLNFVNGGSRTVPRSLYNYLAEAGMVKPTNTNTAQPTNPGNVASNNTNTNNQPTTQRQSFWSRIFSWFSNLFGGNRGNAPAAVADSSALAPEEIENNGSFATAPELPSASMTSGDSSALAPEEPSYSLGSGNNVEDLASAQEAYYKAFAEYNRIVANSNNNTTTVKAALEKLRAAKNRLKAIRKKLK
jgi:hypothetical protein